MSATTEKKHIDQLHFEHELWSSAARFYADELRIYQKWLEDVAGKNNQPEFSKQVEHFQNQFIIQKEQLDILNHLIHEQEDALAHYAQKHPVAVDHVQFKDHTALREQQERYTYLFGELKAEFRAFLGKWL